MRIIKNNTVTFIFIYYLVIDILLLNITTARTENALKLSPDLSNRWITSGSNFRIKFGCSNLITDTKIGKYFYLERYFILSRSIDRLDRNLQGYYGCVRQEDESNIFKIEVPSESISPDLKYFYLNLISKSNSINQLLLYYFNQTFMYNFGTTQDYSQTGNCKYVNRRNNTEQIIIDSEIFASLLTIYMAYDYKVTSNCKLLDFDLYTISSIYYSFNCILNQWLISQSPVVPNNNIAFMVANLEYFALYFSNVHYCHTNAIETIDIYEYISETFDFYTNQNLASDNFAFAEQRLNSSFQAIMTRISDEIGVAGANSTAIEYISMLNTRLDTILTNNASLVTGNTLTAAGESSFKAVSNILSIASIINGNINDDNVTSVESITVASTVISAIETTNILIGKLSQNFTSNSTLTIDMNNILIKLDHIADTNTIETTVPRDNNPQSSFNIPLEEINQIRKLNTDCMQNLVAAYTVYNIDNGDNTNSITSDGIIRITDLVSLQFPCMSNSPINNTNITISFSINENSISDTVYICAFLNESNSTFSTNGLQLITNNDTTVICKTNHLTSFSVMATVIPPPEPSFIENTAMEIISYCLLSISFLCMFISIILFIKAGKKFFMFETNRFYFNYALALSTAILIFIIPIQIAYVNKILCYFSLFLLHYAWTAVFVWSTLICAFLLYLLSDAGLWRRRPLFWYFLPIGWAVPAVPSLLTAVITIPLDSYVTTERKSCFFATNGYTYWGFGGPIFCLIFLNCIGLIVFTVQLIKTGHSTAVGNSSRLLAKKLFLSSIILLPILGLPWLVSIISIITSYFASYITVFAWIFLFTNAPIGLVFLLVFTLRNEQVLDEICFRQKKIKSENTNRSSIGSTIRPLVQNIRRKSSESESKLEKVEKTEL